MQDSLSNFQPNTKYYYFITSGSPKIGGKIISMFPPLNSKYTKIKIFLNQYINRFGRRLKKYCIIVHGRKIQQSC